MNLLITTAQYNVEVKRHQRGSDINTNGDRNLRYQRKNAVYKPAAE